MLVFFVQYPFGLKTILTEFHAGRTGKTRNVHILLAQKPEEKKPLGSPRRRWEDIKQIKQRVGRMDWIHQAHGLHQVRGILDRLSYCQEFLKEWCARWS
jgi:hypothetical protein